MDLHYTFHLVPIEINELWRDVFKDGRLRRYPWVALPSELYYYILDFMEWIPARAGPFGQLPTVWPVIGPEGAETALRIFDALAALFALGPETLTLTGLWRSSADDPSGKYSILHYGRDKILGILNRLSNFAATAARGGHLIHVSDIGDYYDKFEPSGKPTRR